MSLRYLLRGQMRYMNSRGLKVVMASARGPEIENVETFEGIHHHVFPLTRRITLFTDLKALFLLIKWLRKERFDVVHSHTPKAGLIAMLAAKIARVPVRMHTIAGIPWMESHGAKKLILRVVDRIAFRAATNVYPNSQGLMEFVINHRLASKSKLKVLANGSSNGIDLEFFASDRVGSSKQEIRTTMGIKNTDFVYCFIGRIVKNKGINELYYAFRELPINIKLVLVGPFEDHLDPIISEAKQYFETSDRVTLVGYQNDVRPYLKMSDALVFPSYREGFPNVPMQACAMGIPSIVSNINGCNEIIQHRKNGLIVEPKNFSHLKSLMLQLAENKELQMYMSKNARESIASRFDQKVVWEALYAEYIALAEN